MGFAMGFAMGFGVGFEAGLSWVLELAVVFKFVAKEGCAWAWEATFSFVDFEAVLATVTFGQAPVEVAGVFFDTLASALRMLAMSMW